MTTKYSQDGLHPAESARITEQKDEHAIQIYTDGSKSGHGVGVGVAIFIQSKLANQLRFTIHNRCSNNKAEHLAIVKALETIEKSQTNENIPRTVTVNTGSRINLQSLKNTKNYNYLTEEIRKKTIAIEKRNWAIIFTWTKVRAEN